MKNGMRWIFLFVLGVVLGSTAGWTMAGSPKVTDSKLDASADLRKMKTYNWEGPQKKTSDPRVSNAPADRRIRWIVDRYLAGKGFQKQTQGAPDFLVRYSATLSGDFAAAEGSSERNAEEGTLNLTFMDPGSRKVLWEARAESPYTLKDPVEKRNAKIGEAVSKMLQELPI